MNTILIFAAILVSAVMFAVFWSACVVSARCQREAEAQEAALLTGEETDHADH